MDNKLLLDDAEITALTNIRVRTTVRRYELQRKALIGMGVEHLVRPDGSLVVARAHVERLLGIATHTKTHTVKSPNWDAIR
jgi:hypothetical protein